MCCPVEGQWIQGQQGSLVAGAACWQREQAVCPQTTDSTFTDGSSLELGFPYLLLCNTLPIPHKLESSLQMFSDSWSLGCLSHHGAFSQSLTTPKTHRTARQSCRSQEQPPCEAAGVGLEFVSKTPVQESSSISSEL